MHEERSLPGQVGAEIGRGEEHRGTRPEPRGLDDVPYRALFESFDLPVTLHELVFDPAGVPHDVRLIAANPAHERMMGLPAGANAGHTTESLRGDRDRTLLAAAREVLSTGVARTMTTSFPGGRVFDITLFRVDGRTFAITGQETTARVRAEAERERLLQEREELVRTISHDLRAPLTSISTQAQLLVREPESERVAVKARAIAANARRMAQMIRDLVDTARADAGVPLDLAPIELGPFLADLVARLDGGIEAARVRVAVPGGIPTLRADPARLERVVVNLLGNALRHGPPGTPVDLTAAAEPDAVTVEVADRGPGIPPEDLSRIFDRFFRAHAGGEGLGLGLHIARRFVEAHGGTIEARNGPGGGAIVRVRLPLAPPD